MTYKIIGKTAYSLQDFKIITVTEPKAKSKINHVEGTCEAAGFEVRYLRVSKYYNNSAEKFETLQEATEFYNFCLEQMV